MSNIMSSAEIILWDLICPIEKKSTKQKLQIKEEKPEMQVSRKQAKQFSDMKFEDSQGIKETQYAPQSISIKQEVKQSMNNESKTVSVNVGIRSHLFMVLSSSAVGFTIGLLISFIL